jgi:hypothetical protein
MLEKVISGGQTGADIAGIKAAKAAGLKTGGTMPKNFKTLDGDRPEFAKLYGMQEHSSPSYPPRTFKNVYDSDGTVRFAVNWNSSGEICTLNAIRKAKKPYFDVDVIGNTQPADLVIWIKDNNIRVLNVAGNSEKTFNGIEEFVLAFLTETFWLVQKVNAIA